MNWASALSMRGDLEEAVAEACAQSIDGLDGERPDLAIAFVSNDHADSYEALPALVREGLGRGLLLGCSAGGVIGGGSEVEQRPAVSITVAALPDVDIVPFHVDAADLPAPDAGRGAWENLLGVDAGREPSFVLLPDPFSFQAEEFLSGLDISFPASNKVGGLASGGRSAGANALYLGPSLYRSGLVGVALSGNVEMDTVVAQGCRPIGDPMFVTACDGNMVRELDGRPALAVLKDLYGTLGEDDRRLFQHSLFLGIVMVANRQDYRQGDFLIRNILGVDQQTGALAVGANLRENLVVRFHLRDAETSAADLDELLARYAGENEWQRPEGALLFSCLGRGQYLYGHADHDSNALRHHLGEIPVGGFFCNGEIGEVHARTYLHGYTSSFGLFKSRPRA